MSTRGTYRILVKKDYENIDLCFYIHCDNYPEGAAGHFKKALALEWKYQHNGKNFAKRFASIDGSEFTKGHEEHGDTEYQYDITETREGINVKCFDVWEKTIVFEGTMEEFIKKYTEEKCGQ
jgi:hypothetical protein